MKNIWRKIYELSRTEKWWWLKILIVNKCIYGGVGGT